MDTERACEIREQVIKKLASILDDNQFSEILINLGKKYLLVLDGLREKLGRNENITIVEGKIGERLHKMNQWLEFLLKNEEQPTLLGETKNESQNLLKNSLRSL
jgi:hypothetical protein